MTRGGIPMVGFSFFLLVHMVDGVGIKSRLVDTQDDGAGGASSSSCAKFPVVVYASDWYKVMCPKLLVRMETWCRR